MVYGGAMQSGGGMRKYMWAPEQNLGKNGRKMGGGEEVVLPGAGRSGSWPDVRWGADVQCLGEFQARDELHVGGVDG